MPQQKRPSREGTTMVAGNFPIPVALAFNKLVARLGMERDHRMTNQMAIAEALIDVFKKYEQPVPPDLYEALESGTLGPRRQTLSQGD
jgi:hypothetical protein